MRLKFLFILMISSLVWADSIELFTEMGRPIQRYDTVVKGIFKGSTVSYPDKSEFKILERLEGGGTNKIFRARLLGSGKEGILRVPIEIAALQFATKTLDGYELLKQEKIRVPELIQGVRGQYVFQEQVRVELTALDLLEGNLKKCRISEGELFRRLVLLLEKTARFRRLDDALPGNVYFNGTEWGVLDWQGKHAFIDSRRKGTLLDSWASEKNSRPQVIKFWMEANEATERVRKANPHWLDPNCVGRFQDVLE